MTEDMNWWITAIDLPALSGLFWMIWRTRREYGDVLAHLRDLVDARYAQLREALSAFKLEAAKTYADNPTAFHLRAMNMLYEGLKRSNSTIVIVPSSAVETMQLGGLAGMTALSTGLARQAETAAAPPPAEHPPKPHPK